MKKIIREFNKTNLSKIYEIMLDDSIESYKIKDKIDLKYQKLSQEDKNKIKEKYKRIKKYGDGSDKSDYEVFRIICAEKHFGDIVRLKKHCHDIESFIYEGFSYVEARKKVDALRYELMEKIKILIVELRMCVIEEGLTCNDYDINLLKL